MTASAATTSQRQAWAALRLPAPCHGFVRASGDLFESTDPATGEVVAELAVSTPDDVDRAVAAARQALESSDWGANGEARARVLYGFAQALRADQDRLAELLTREQGKTIHEARIEIASSAKMTEYYAGLARMVYGRSAVLGQEVTGVVLREPVGVVAVITPWNWPLVLLVRSLAPALAAGNATVVKPASLTSAITVEALALLASQPGLPAGILMCVLGSGGIVGDALVGHDGTDMIAFTGETETGIRVMKRAAEGLRKVALELGGKAPNVVFADAKLDKALAGAESAIFTTCGQICTAGSRLLVEDALYDEFLERLGAVTNGLRVGDGLDPASQLGPVASASQRNKVLDYVERGKAEGRLVAGGAALAGEPYDAGCFVSPAIFADLPADSSLIRDEIFGPVLTVQRFGDEAEAVALANDTEYGLAAGLWTQDVDRAWRVGRAIRAGTIWINTYHHFYDEMEVGGFKRSGVGRQQGLEGLYEFTETKHLNFDGKSTLW
ncbi:NAD-dependent aldehyde dehydrogenase [Gaiella occulta]|uniref:NAD-dependent aldehyde dehydrogenase n=1 Tax=Gaiella occulta TaxID=1002870 RepID=A0A7M2Z1L7_9ACTN|nr:aldehyde dehydrogenase family protein [Gaiella occulta]RDI75542.1 NAD-dependent aldehyde dehydrogenase [Gaiella occulta]